MVCENRKTRMFKMSINRLILLFFYTQLTIGLEGPFVCYGDNGKKQCCYNYEDVNGKCEMCKNGTSSKQGGKCIPCVENMYGYKCLEQCYCSKFQRCDTANGCVVDLQSTEKFSTESYLEYYTRDNLTTTNDEAQDQYTYTYHTMRDESTAKPIEMDDNFSRVLHQEIFIYSVCVTLVIVVIGISLIVYKCKKKHLKKIVIAHRASMRQSVNESTNQEYIYDEIDESGIIDIETEHRNRDGRSNIPAYFDFGNAYHSMSSTELNDDYLDPRHSSNDNSKNDKDGDSNAESATICVDASGYLSPYQQLQDNWKELSHKYELSVTSDILECNASYVKEEKDTNLNENSYSPSDDAPNLLFLPPIEKDITNGIVQSTKSMTESETKSISSCKQESCFKISEHVAIYDTGLEINDDEDDILNDYLDAKSC